MSSKSSDDRRLIEGVKKGDNAVIQRLWVRYFEKLVGVARHRLRGIPRRDKDEEDVALSAIDSFCREAKLGRYPLLMDKDGLWRLLLKKTADKVCEFKRRAFRWKRTREVGESALAGSAGSDVVQGETGLAQIIGKDPTPEFAAAMAEEVERLLDSLNDETRRTVALLKMQGYTNKEIAQRLDCSVSSVERCLRVIRAILQREAKP